MNTFLVMAYRWGFSNDHQYIVGAWPCVSVAAEHAEQEVANRGGKYCCAVYRIEGGDQTLVYYKDPHSETAVKPHPCSRILLREQLGFAVTRAIDNGDPIPEQELRDLIKTYKHRDRSKDA